MSRKSGRPFETFATLFALELPVQRLYLNHERVGYSFKKHTAFEELRELLTEFEGDLGSGKREFSVGMSFTIFDDVRTFGIDLLLVFAAAC